MKTMKFVSGLVSVALAAMSLASVASAASDISVKVGSAEVDGKGSTFSVGVDFASVPSSGINAVDFAISYDSSLVKITDVSAGSITETGAASKEGELAETIFSWKDTGSQIVLIWATGVDDSSAWITKSGTFVTLKGEYVGSGDAAELKVVPVSRAAYPDSSEKNSAIVLSAAGSTDYGCVATAGKVSVNKTATADTIGDVNCNGTVGIEDVILLSRYVANDDVDVSDQGIANAACDQNSSITMDDVSAILQFIARQVKSLPIS